MENCKSESFDDLVVNLLNFFKERGYHPETIKSYKYDCRRIEQYLSGQGITQYDSEACRLFIEDYIAGREYTAIPIKEKNIIRTANVLLEYSTTGAVTYKAKRPKKPITGAFSISINSYISYRKSKNTAASTLDAMRLYLGRFKNFLLQQSIDLESEITGPSLLLYVKSLSYCGPGAMYRSLSITRAYLRYLYENDYTAEDLSYIIPRSNYKKQAKLPSTYTEKEITDMLGVIDRANPQGKRDYAMVVLSAYLGLRSSDVCQLTFDEIDWDNDLIKLEQKKTGEHIELPLLPLIGNAIIDYLKYGRRKSDLPYVFLRLNHEAQQLHYATFHSIVSKYLRQAGIETRTRRRGPHALRHSLAGRLLEAKTPLPIISEVLGHTNTETTKAYLRIDLSALRQCALNVPTTDYYSRNMGWNV